MSIYKVKTPLKLLFASIFVITILPVEAQTGTSNATAARTPMARLTLQLLLPGQEVSKQAADGLGVYFSEEFDNTVAYEDSYKLTNPDENVGIERDGRLLCIEGRKPVNIADTLPLRIWKLCQKNYTFKIDVANFSAKVEVYLHDNYLDTNIPLDNNAETMVPFNLTGDAGSVARDRFVVLFATYATLPVELTGVKACQKKKGVEISWKAENESNIERYEVEQSANAQTFATAGFVQATNHPGVSASYSWFDANPTAVSKYYRIKSYDKSGEIKHSAVVKVEGTQRITDVAVFVRPGQRNAVNVSFKNSIKGNYALSLVSLSGQSVYTGRITHPGGSSNQEINVNNYLPAGLYQMVVYQDNKRENFPIMIQ